MGNAMSLLEKSYSCCVFGFDLFILFATEGAEQPFVHEAKPAFCNRVYQYHKTTQLQYAESTNLDLTNNLNVRTQY